MAVVPHLRLPFRIGTGGAADTVEQDSHEEVAQSVAVLMRTPVGERSVVPEYGISDPTFLGSPAAVITSLKLQVETWEPRAEVEVTSSLDAYDELTRTYSVNVRPKVDVIPAPSNPGIIQQAGEVIAPSGGSTWDSLGTIQWDELGTVSWNQI